MFRGILYDQGVHQGSSSVSTEFQLTGRRGPASYTLLEPCPLYEPPAGALYESA